MIDKRDNFEKIECFDFGTNYAHSLNCVVDGEGEVFFRVVKASGEEFKFRVLSTDAEFEETFGDIKSIEIASTCEYRAIIRR